MAAQLLFARKAAMARGNIYFVRTREEYGRDAYYVVQVAPAKEAMFRHAMRGSAFIDYSSFGPILAKGFGHVPDADTVARLKRDYDYELPV